jgi:hypothetical protein
MKKFYLIGDCHSARILEHHKRNSSNIDLKIWGRRGLKCFGLDLESMNQNKDLSSGTEVGCGDFNTHEETILKFDEVKDDGVIAAWIGYVDIRQFLPKYKNTQEIVKTYVEDLLSFYPKSQIFFIEPLPQFTEMLLKYEGISPSYTYEERLLQNKEFIYYLNQEIKSKNLLSPITQEEILNAVGVTEFTTDLTPKDRPHPVDSLTPELMKKIYDLFIKRFEMMNSL